LTEGPHGVSDWGAVARLPGVARLATDPYWKNFGEPAGPFVERFARLVADTARANGVEPQLWVPSFGLHEADVPELEAAIAAARSAGVDDVWTWGYEACGHMTALATPDAPAVWEAVTAALTGGARTAPTERIRADLRDLDLRPTIELVRIVNDADRSVASAVADAAVPLAATIDEVVEHVGSGGRLVYVGAGTSGRLAQLDAAECGPTFSTDRVVALFAGDDESAEDDVDAGARAGASTTSNDVVIGVSASGTTPYTVAALRAARAAGAFTVALTCAHGTELERTAEHSVVLDVGPEVIAGSTRLKAGTAQKLALNTISTVTFVKLGKTFGNLMVELQASNAKLRARARRAVAIATGAADDEVEDAIVAANGDAKVALVSLAAGIDVAEARERLDASGGSVRQALDVVG
jgi:N-acetylmuramic acid 6-phosphate etherase